MKEKVETIQNMKRISSNFRVFRHDKFNIKNLSEEIAPLRLFVKNETAWTDNGPQEHTYKRLKKLLKKSFSFELL